MSNRQAGCLLSMCLCLVTANLLLAQPAEQRIDQFVNGQTRKGKFSGTVLVAHHGKVVLMKGYGYADQDKKLLNSSGTKFYIGSVTKPFVAVLVMRLVEERKIKLDELIGTYLPQLNPQIGRRVKVKHLLQQTSGIKDYTESTLFCSAAQRFPIDPQGYLACINELGFDFEPGSKFSYSNSNYYLLGVLLEHVSGMRFGELLQSQLLKPLGMANTGYELIKPESLAQGYTIDKDSLIATQIKHISKAYSAGGMYSTVDDLYKFDQALRGEKLLKKSSLDAIFAENKAVEPSYYGYGWYVGYDPGMSDQRTFHEGGLAGFSACLDRYLTNNLCIIVLSNFEFVEARSDISEPITKLILKK